MIRTRQLEKKYGHVAALCGLDLVIEPGEIYGLLGPNGSGKTTALRLLMGYLRPTSGSAQIAGLDCWRQSLAIRGHVGYLPGEMRLYPNLTGEQTVRFFTRLRQMVNLDRARQLAKQFDLPLTQRIEAMTTGTRQKLGLVLLLAHPTDLLILDEPTTGLDPTVRLRLLQLLRDAQAEGTTILFSSHVLNEVEQLCHRVGLLRDGELVAEERMDNLQEMRRVLIQFANPITIASPSNFSSPDGPTPSGVDTLPGVSEVVATDLHIELTLRGPMEPLLKWLRHFEVRDLRIESGGLLTLYRQVHGEERLS